MANERAMALGICVDQLAGTFNQAVLTEPPESGDLS